MVHSAPLCISMTQCCTLCISMAQCATLCHTDAQCATLSHGVLFYFSLSVLEPTPEPGPAPQHVPAEPPEAEIKEQPPKRERSTATAKEDQKILLEKLFAESKAKEGEIVGIAKAIRCAFPKIDAVPADLAKLSKRVRNYKNQHKEFYDSLCEKYKFTLGDPRVKKP